MSFQYVLGFLNEKYWGKKPTLITRTILSYQKYQGCILCHKVCTFKYLCIRVDEDFYNVQERNMEHNRYCTFLDELSHECICVELISSDGLDKIISSMDSIQTQILCHILVELLDQEGRDGKV